MTPSSRSDVWRARGHEIVLDRTRVMGVVNVTPDSFYDGGRFEAADDAIRHGRRLLDQGADLLDVGGESTRPGAEPVPAEEELERVLPVVEGLVEPVETAGALLSVDTRKAEVAEVCLDAGAHVVNDVTAMEDAAMAGVVADRDAGIVLMHMQGTPQTMQDDPRYGDVVEEVVAHLAKRVEAAREAGIDPEAICVDPGIGFGKTVAHNVRLIRELPRLAELGHPVLVGPSRKSFLGRIGGPDDPDQRLYETLGAVAVCVVHGADVVRVHDVEETRRILRVVDAVSSNDPDPDG